MKILFEKRKNIFSVPVAAVLIYLSVRYAAECSKGILNGLSFSVQVLIPSLFLFMTIAAYIVKSGAAEVISAPFSGLSRAVFGLPSPALSVILLSMVGGYPVGARCVASLFERNVLTGSQAKKTACIAVCAGPGFLLNFIGTALLNSRKTGAILLVSQLLAVILTGMLIGHTVRCDVTTGKAAPILPAGNLLVESVADASKATFSMCAMVVVFSAAVEVTSSIFKSVPEAVDLLSAFLEITTGCNRLCGRYPLPLIAFFVGFGGLSVHFQIFAALKTLTVNKLLFFLFRIIEGIITALLTYILVVIFPESTTVFSNITAPVNMATSSSLWGSLALGCSALCFLGSLDCPRTRWSC